MQAQEKFIKEAEKKISDRDFRQRMELALKVFSQKRESGVLDFSNLELARQRAAYTKWKVSENLDKYLVDFEVLVIRRGGKVVWAYDAQNALMEIDSIIKRTNSKKIVKSKSDLAYEIGLTKHLRANSAKVVETDFGDYIIDLLDAKSYHPIATSINQKLNEIGPALNKSIKSSLEADQEELVSDIRAEIRSSFYEADLGITGANFLFQILGQ